jgi:hypothetical protein
MVLLGQLVEIWEQQELALAGCGTQTAGLKFWWSYFSSFN